MTTVITVAVPGAQGPQGPQGSTGPTGPAGGVSSVNTKTGAVVINADDIGDGTTKVIMTPAERTKLSQLSVTHTHSVSDLTATGTRDSTTYLRGDNTWSVPSGSAGSALNSTLDSVRYVSKSGNDSNNGLSWATAKLTIAAGLAALNSTGGTVEVGNGVYQESLSLTGNRTVRGQSRYGTVIELTTTGNLITISNDNNARLEHLGLRFASSSVTGSLLYLTNSFTCVFDDVRFTGTTTANQYGMRYDANAGDCLFLNSYFDSLDRWVSSDSTLMNFVGCVFSTCINGIYGGDATGATARAGASFTQCTFRGTGTRYVWLNGKSQAWTFDSCWWDGGATTAIEVGSTGTTKYGPWSVSITNSPALVGATKSLVLNSCEYTNIGNVAFTNTGSNPTELTISKADCPRGTIYGVKSLQSISHTALVPMAWDGAAAAAASADTTVQLIETGTFLDAANGLPSFEEKTHKRIVIRVTNRTTGSAAVTLTFPEAFTTTFAGGQFFKTFDNTGIGAGLTFNATSVTFPTGVAVASGMVVIEGW